MKNNFIEVTHGKDKILINLDNVGKIAPSGNRTSFVFNFPKKDELYIILADEPYEAIKKLIESRS